MNKEKFENIKERLKNFKYNSLEYMEISNVSGYKARVDNNDLLLLHGFNKENNITECHWAANESNELLKEIQKIEGDVLITFVPPEWVEEFKRMNYTTNAIWNDYLNNDIEKNIRAKDELEFLKKEECLLASNITLECKNQSRGFSGQSEEWMKQWLDGAKPGIKDSNVIVHRVDEQIVGIICVATYGHDYKKGTIVWIREVAVLPKYQNRGIATKLFNQALHYGLDCGATRGFLAADENNINAIKLYEKFGFAGDSNEAQIDMIKHSN